MLLTFTSFLKFPIIRKINSRYSLILDSWILYENEFTTVQDDLSNGGKN